MNRFAPTLVRLWSFSLCLVLWIALLFVAPITHPTTHQAFAFEHPPSPIAHFGNWVALESFTTLDASKPAPGHPFEVVLNWRVLTSTVQDLVATVSLNNGSRQPLAQFPATLPAGLPADQTISTRHTLLLPEVSPDTLLYFATQRQKEWPIVMQVAVRVAKPNGQVALTFARLSSGTSSSTRRWNSVVLASWRREDIALTDCHTTEPISAANPITLTWPTAGKMTQGYWYAHRGVDFADARGKPVRAAQDGKVVMSQWNRDGFGYIIEIEHGTLEDAAGSHVVQTLYAHLDQLNVRVGQQVKAGQIIGKMGLTGNTSGPHLHFELRIGRMPKNPFCFLPPLASR
jgi:murein DD-endopeptidase MepM/ murein hydrolase activator NlpD